MAWRDGGHIDNRQLEMLVVHGEQHSGWLPSRALLSREGAGHDTSIQDQHVNVVSRLQLLLCKGLHIVEVRQVQLAHLDAALDLTALPDRPPGNRDVTQCLQRDLEASWQSTITVACACACAELASTEPPRRVAADAW